MGSPELPNDDDNIARPPANNLPMHGANTTGSDESDNENMNEEYVGYQPLAIDEDTIETTNQYVDSTMGDDEDDDYDYQVNIFSIITLHNIKTN